MTMNPWKWAVAGTAVGVELLLYRRWHLGWGASADERRAVMPGDDLLPSSQFTATRAIIVDAAPEAVWPWIVQVGVGRGGFYSYDRLDNAGHHSSETVLPRWQHPMVGDVAAPMTTAQREGTCFRVHTVDEPHQLLWAKSDSTWSWRLTPLEGGRRTRLVTRLRQQYDWTSPGVLFTVPLLEIADFPMMRRMLLGIRQRAERGAGHGRDQRGHA